MSGVKRYMLGREPILAADGSRLVDRKGRGAYVTSAGAGPSIGKHILMAYLPPERAVAGERFLVEYLGERYPVTVAVADATPVFDPENTRIRS
jgi:glycine cleavage system aminomethyltransferase T